MARPLRIHIPGMPYHVMSRGNAKQCIFEDDTDHLRFLERLQASLERFSVTCVAYALMWNHFHLLVIPRQHTLSRMMQHLNGAYSGDFNRRHARVGHFVQGRPTMKIVDSDAYFLTAVRYVLRNPVDSHRAKDPTDWPWSSCRATFGLEPCPSFLSIDPIWRALDAPDAASGQTRLQQFLARENAGEGFAELENSLLYGGESLARRVDPLLPAARKNREFRYEERYATRPRLEDLFDGATTQREIDAASLEAFCHHAYTLSAIGELLHHPSGTIWAWIQRAAKATGQSPLGARSPQRRRARLSPPPRRGQISIFE